MDSFRGIEAASQMPLIKKTSVKQLENLLSSQKVQKSVVFSKTEHNRMQLWSASIKKQDARFDPATVTVSVLSPGVEGASQLHPPSSPSESASFRNQFCSPTDHWRGRASEGFAAKSSKKPFLPWFCLLCCCPGLWHTLNWLSSLVLDLNIQNWHREVSQRKI